MLSVNFVGLQLKNPLVLSSGILDLSGVMMKRLGKYVGAVTTKGIGSEPRQGHKNPTVISRDNYMLNAIGLSNPGMNKFKEEIDSVKKAKIPVIANIFGTDTVDFVDVAKNLASCVDALELNVSCPNLSKTETFGQLIGQNPKLVSEVVSWIKKSVNIPIIVKLTPNVNDIAEIAKAAEKAGANAISAINAVGPGMIINIEAKKPILANKFGGMSGPAIKPLAVACVYKIYDAVKIPILGIGGITTGKDAIEMLMAGASAVGIGSAVYFQGINVFKKINNEIIKWLKSNGYKSIEELVGIAHR